MVEEMNGGRNEGYKKSKTPLEFVDRGNQVVRLHAKQFFSEQGKQ